MLSLTLQIPAAKNKIVLICTPCCLSASALFEMCSHLILKLKAPTSLILCSTRKMSSNLFLSYVIIYLLL
uniref:Uncharacterized protein n=1 Tax=Octopus bimaculoides TaxID=37653 RepID=A0A0L8HI79_OCTBM